ncbi:thermonuclease family protein [Pseudomonas sp. NPDC090208]|uniref:thermonuclease family protein n=1 Tax=Pseudomonas sp. NPDC090208 TaxID=3364478 RepID=UPI0037FD84AC
MKAAALGVMLGIVALPQWAFGAYGSMPLRRDQIVDVYDGDTITISVQEWPGVFGQRLGVRVNGMDTPERHSHCADPAAKANEERQAMLARTELLSLLDSGQPIELRNLDRDKYFRLLAEVWVGDQNVAAVLIGEGLAVPYHGEKKVGWCLPG